MLLPSITFCQYSVDVTEKNSPGDALIGFTHTYYAGAGLTVAGTAMLIGGLFNDEEMLLPLGIAVQSAGLLVIIYSFSRIGRAGRIMNEKGIGIASNGIGVSYRF